MAAGRLGPEVIYHPLGRTPRGGPVIDLALGECAVVDSHNQDQMNPTRSSQTCTIFGRSGQGRSSADDVGNSRTLPPTSTNHEAQI